MNSTPIDSALRLAEFGYSVFPVHDFTAGRCSCRNGRRNCPSAAKHPRMKGWQEQASQEPQELRAMFAKYPRSNIGVATGRRHGLVVLDFDSRNGGLHTWEALQQKLGHRWSDGCLRVTRNRQAGFHLYFRCEHDPKTAANILPGLDVRGNGGFVVGPGSVHASGNRYDIVGDTWIGYPHDLVSVSELPLLPPQLLQLTHEGHKEDHKKNARRTQEKHIAKDPGGNADPPTEQQLDLIAKAIADTIPLRAGRRHSGTFEYSRRLRHIFGEAKHTSILRRLFRSWYDEAQASAERNGFTIQTAYPQAWQEFLTAFERVHTPSDGSDGMAAVASTMGRQLASEEPMPGAVVECLDELGYSDDELLRALVLLLWTLSEHAKGQSFPCSNRFAAELIAAAGISNSNGESFTFQYVGQKLLLLMMDGVIHRTAQGRRGSGSGMAAEFRWIWESGGGAVVTAWSTEKRLRVAELTQPQNRQGLPRKKPTSQERARPELRPEWLAVCLACRRAADAAGRKQAIGSDYGYFVDAGGYQRWSNSSDYERRQMAAEFFHLRDGSPQHQP